MPRQLTTEDFRQSLTDHVASKGAEIREKFGPGFGWNQLQLMLQDRASVRYPCDIRFGASLLLEGEPAHAIAKGDRPEDGFILLVHPVFASDGGACVRLILYQLVLVNYGEFASSEDAETFGASVLGISRDDYYQQLCLLADRIPSGGSCC